MMVKPAKDGAWTNDSGALYRARDWPVLVQGGIGIPLADAPASFWSA
jgi:hypothetical protein